MSAIPLLLLVINAIFVTPLFGKDCCQKINIPFLKKKKFVDPCTNYVTRDTCMENYPIKNGGCFWYCDIKTKGGSFNVKVTDEYQVPDSIVTARTDFTEQVTAKKEAIASKQTAIETASATDKPALKGELKILKKELNGLLDGEIIFSDTVLNELKAELGTPAHAMLHYDILTWDNEGNGQLYEYTDDFTASVYAKEEAQIQAIIDHYLKSLIPETKGKSLTEACSMSFFENRKDFTENRDGAYINPVVSGCIKRHQRRLLDDNTTQSHRRLAIGNTLAPNVANHPDSTMGTIRYDKPWIGINGVGGNGIATIIISNKQEGTWPFRSWYDYLITAGHNLYCHEMDRNSKFCADNTVPYNDPIRFVDRIRFNRFGSPGGNSHPSRNFRRAWVPVYGRPRAGVMDKHPHDYAIVKFEVAHDARNPFSRLSVVDTRWSPLTMYTPNQKVEGIIPDAAGHHGYLYQVTPSDWTQGGDSGAPLFYANMDIIMAIHVGKNGLHGVHQRAVSNRITAAKQFNINHIIAGDFDRRAQLAAAKESYYNILPQFAHKQLQNEFDFHNQYPQQQQQNIEPMYYSDNNEVIKSLNELQHSLFIGNITIITFIILICCLISICAVCIPIGVVIAKKLMLSKTKKISQNQYDIFNNHQDNV